MFCGNCGKQIPDGTSICPSCGYNLDGAEQGNAVNAVTPVNQVYNEPVPTSPEVPAENGYGYQEQPQQYYDQAQQSNPQDYYAGQNYGNQGNYYDGLGAATPEQQGFGGQGQPGQPGQPGSGVSLALGICSISIGVLFGLGFGVFGALIGLGLGIAGLILSINYNKAYPNGAKAGFITSIIGLSLSFVFLIGCAACGASSKGYGCYGCIGGSCTVANDAQNTYNNLFR